MSDPTNETARQTSRYSSILLRLIASFVFIPCLYIITKAGGYYFLALMDIVILIGIWEFYSMMEWKGIRPYKGIGCLCGLVLSWYFYIQNGTYANLFLTLALIGIMSLELTRRDNKTAIYHISTTVLGVIYIAFLGSHLVLLREFPNEAGLDYNLGSSLVFLAFLVTWSGDTLAYTVGKSIGRHPLLPRISGKKTVEGSAGCVAGSLLGGVVAKYSFAPFLELWQALTIGAMAALIGQLGDLVESMIKRDAEIKDTSDTIPGHGGVLDRFDSLLFTAPLLYYFVKFVVFR
jgi:phosphatidate cytidylyltransferase